ncbi:alpha/beta hydrolase [Enterococcus sp. BWM-S5]|uniref:Alpha/beta hydrolase n=1 Tax=Enterococcus larvae TaxID=2794352 RepID=A0ABS4CEL6_9ENTE|nr:alpha/beta hydrolase [Enterococcus larvae]MBP1044818.1 alpha/beta hydrolase [Enterococcus larvae]
MEKKNFNIGNIPAVLYGRSAEKVFLFVHGQSGNKEEAEQFAAVAAEKGWQVLSIDLPEHGERKAESGFVPWIVVPELQLVWQYIETHWQRFGLRGNSIGVWFSLLALRDKEIEQSLFVSPILDMEQLIRKMMRWADVSEEQLETEKIIQTDFGQELSWEYLTFARQNQINKWKSPSAILYGDQDNLTDHETITAFSLKFQCDLTVMEDGEHWFHTMDQLIFLTNWLKESVGNK